MSLRVSSGAWILALLACSLQLDHAVVLGKFTVYQNELLVALILPAAVVISGADAEGRNELARWTLAFSPLGLWLALHAFGPDSTWGGIKAALRAAQLACGLALPVLLLKNQRDFNFALGVALLAMLATCFWAFSQSVAGPGHPLNLGREAELINGFQAAAAGFGHHNQMGAFFTAAFCVSLTLWLDGTHKALAALALAASITGLGSSYSRGAWAGAMLAALCFFPLLAPRQRRFAAGAGLLIVLLAFAGPSNAFRERLAHLTGDSDRAEHFRAAWKLWDGHAFWGWGTEGLEAQAKLVAATMTNLSPEGRASFSSHLHNTYLQIGLSAGWPVFLGWLIFFGEPMRRMAAAWRRPEARAWAVGLFAALLAFAFQASTDLLAIHARGLAISLCWGLLLAGMKFAVAEERLASGR